MVVSSPPPLLPPSLSLTPLPPAVFLPPFFPLSAQSLNFTFSLLVPLTFSPILSLSPPLTFLVSSLLPPVFTPFASFLSSSPLSSLKASLLSLSQR